MANRTTLLKRALVAAPLAFLPIKAFAGGSATGQTGHTSSGTSSSRSIPAEFQQRAVMYGHDQTGAPVGIVPHMRDNGADFIAPSGQPYPVQGNITLEGANHRFMDANGYTPNARAHIDGLVSPAFSAWMGRLPLNLDANQPHKPQHRLTAPNLPFLHSKPHATIWVGASRICKVSNVISKAKAR